MALRRGERMREACRCAINRHSPYTLEVSRCFSRDADLLDRICISSAALQPSSAVTFLGWRPMRPLRARPPPRTPTGDAADCRKFCSKGRRSPQSRGHGLVFCRLACTNGQAPNRSEVDLAIVATPETLLRQSVAMSLAVNLMIRWLRKYQAPQTAVESKKQRGPKLEPNLGHRFGGRAKH